MNHKGKALFQYLNAENGIIMSDPYLLFKYDFHTLPEKIEFLGYDVLINGRLYTEIPEKFLLRVIRDEKDPK